MASGGRVKDSGRVPFPPKDPTPAPGDYDPHFPDTRIPPSIHSRLADPRTDLDLPFYNVPPPSNSVGPKWPSRPSVHSHASSSRKSAQSKTSPSPSSRFPLNKTQASQKPISTGENAINDVSEETVNPPENVFVVTNPNDSNHSSPDHLNNTPPFVHVEDTGGSEILGASIFPGASSFPGEGNIQDIECTDRSDNVGVRYSRQPYHDVEQRQTPSVSSEREVTPHFSHSKPRPLCYFLSDGILAVTGLNCMAVTLFMGIVHTFLWTKHGQCIFSGVWMIVFGLAFLIVEGMKVPKLNAFNKLTVLYKPSSVLNRSPHWVKLIFYSMGGIIPLAVCVKWTSGIGAGALIISGFLYGFKQIQEYSRMELQEASRRPNEHVPISMIA